MNMRNTRRFFTFLSVALVSTAIPYMASAEDLEMEKTNYVCERGVSLPTVYINTPGGESYAVVSVDGKLVTMKTKESASGALYVSLDEQDNYRLWTKGQEATLNYLEADDTSAEIVLLSDCKAD